MFKIKTTKELKKLNFCRVIRLLMKLKPDRNYAKLVRECGPKLDKLLDIVNLVRPEGKEIESIDLDDEK